MDFTLSADQVALRDGLRRFLAEQCGSASVRGWADEPGGIDRVAWRTLAAMGVFGLCIDESDGGLGLGRADATVVFEELGARFVPGPTIACFLSAGLVDGVVDGSTVVSIVDAGDRPVVEHPGGIDHVLVTHADRVDLADAADADPVPRPFDPLTPVAFLATTPTGPTIADAATADRFRRDGGLLTAALQVGLARGAVELAAEHARNRRQFGRPIGSFQAVKHLLADAATATDIARAAVQHAGAAIDEGSVAATDVDRARVVASRAAQRAARTCVQVHGGLGYTWELDAHLFLKRAAVADTWFGSVDGAIDRISDVL